MVLLRCDIRGGIVAFNREVPVGRLQFCDALLWVGSLQVNDTATQGAQVQTHIFGELSQRFRIYHANRQHAGILSARLTADYCSAGDRVPGRPSSLPLLDAGHGGGLTDEPWSWQRILTYP